MRRLAALAGLLAVAAAPMSYAEFRARIVQPPALRTIAYGADPLQHVELWRPAGRGPFPVVLMLHGGCWQTGVAKADIMHAVAQRLVQDGYAVWNVEYRGVDVPSGGYPGTFQDVATAADLLARTGPSLGLRTDVVIALGHSAGGHLALWLAGRPNIPRRSVLWSPNPLHLVSAVSIGGLPDLRAARTEAAEACGADTVDRLVGSPTRERPDVFADTSPPALLPLYVHAIELVSGAEDPIAPPIYAARFARQARVAGNRVDVRTASNAGHFELIAPRTKAWEETVGMAIAAPFAAETDGAQPRPR